MRSMRLTLFAVLLTVTAGAFPAFAQAKWEVARTMQIGGEGGWDYVTVDVQTQRLFVTRTTHTQVIDAVSGKVLGDIPGQKRSHGVALDPKLNRGFITDGGGSGAVIVFNLKTYAVLGTIATVPDSDGIIYDAKADRVLAVAGDSNALMIFSPDIDPKHGEISTIQLGGAPEFLAADGERAYVNLEDKDMVAVVDLKSNKVIARWPVAPGGHPVGMAMDPSTHRLFIGCRNPQKMIVMNAENGKVEAALPIGSGVDATSVDGEQAFASCRDGSLVVVGERGGSDVVEQTVKTAEGARTMGIDTMRHHIYLPTAELEPQTTGRPKMKPGSFMIVEVKRH